MSHPISPRIRDSVLTYLLVLGLSCSLAAQRGGGTPVGVMGPQGTLPLINVGGGDVGATESNFARLDFATMMLDEQQKKDQDVAARKKLVDSGLVSALDLQAPSRAVSEYNQASELMRGQKAKEAAKHLEKALAIYPDFVSAHNSLGLAYIDLDDETHATEEFQTAAKLDDKFPGSFTNLGKLALERKDFSAAETYLQHASDLLPRDSKILSALAYAENGTHEYKLALDTAGRVHAMEHKQLANVHYVAAASAIALQDYAAAKRELQFFVAEDPTNALAPSARTNIDIIDRNETKRINPSASTGPHAIGNVQPMDDQSLADSDRLKAELSSLREEAADDGCSDCDATNETSRPAATGISPPSPVNGGFTVRKNVDEVAVFFSASQHGHNVYDLQQKDITLLDNSLPPERIIQFIPQSKLPMRLALLIDTSGSVEQRLTFEKHAAEKFIERVLTNTSDLAFVEGFANAATVTQDFTSDHAALTSGIEKLSSAGGTSIFDALSEASWKLGAYPEHERVARVIVILTDGEENSSHGTLKQAIRDAESSGVTIYCISTRTGRGDRTAADRMLEALAERTGGESYFPGDLAVLGGTFEKLSDLIRSRYLIAYRPQGFTPDGKFRSIAVTAQKDGKQLRVRVRNGYHTRLETSAPPRH